MTSAAIIGLLVFGAMTVLILIGVPVAISMLSCSLIGFLLVSTPGMAISQFTNALFLQSTSYTFAVVPLFMIVGTLAGDTGIAEGTFVAAKKWLSKQRGGLLNTVVAANMIFGACSGISAAGNIVFAKIAMPQLEKNNYDRSVSLGTITASGTLSVLIPPSIPILTFSLLVEVSVGSALMCGVSAGILFAALMFVVIQVIAHVAPGKIPPASKESVPLRERLATLTLLVPIIVLFGLIVGGSFFGWFPATVGGAVACVVIYFYAAVIKKMSFKAIFKSTLDGVQGFAGIYLLIVSGKLFGRFITLTGLADQLATLISNAHMAPFAVFCIILVFYIFCGMFLDCLSIVIITVPVVFPLLTGMGYNELVMTMVLVFVMEMATLTPPIGMSVFHVANALQISTTEVFKGVIPFFFVDLAVTLLIVLIPDLILWLPRLMGMAT